MAKKLSANDLAEQLAGNLTEKIMQIQERSVAEVREYLGKRLADLASGTRAADQGLLECVNDPNFVLTIDFRAGLALAAELVADPTFDY